MGWKAVLSCPIFEKRQYGCWRTSISAAVENILKKVRDSVPDKQFKEARARALELQARNDRHLPSGRDEPMHGAGGSVATSEATGDQPRPADQHGKPVQFVHQIYGLFGDKKPMSEEFQASMRAWSGCAVCMGATYIMWDADMVETLMRSQYDQFWDMYQHVRYPVMRADIARIAILHAYGGLYADLDTMPNRQWYAEAPLAICSVIGPKHGGGHNKSDWRGGSPKGNTQPRKEFWDMEVIVGERACGAFIRWLDHIRKEISTKRYGTGAFWNTARMRYIYHTTGPASMHRFLRLSENRDITSRMLFLKMNWFKDSPRLTYSDRQQFDVLTRESNSYFTKEHEIIVPVGETDVVLPSTPCFVRTIGKSHVRLSKMRQSATLHVPTQQHQSEQDTRTILTLTEKVRALTEERLHTIKHVDALRAYFVEYSNCAGVRSVLSDMPAELCHWIAPHHERSARSAFATAPSQTCPPSRRGIRSRSPRATPQRRPTSGATR